MEFAFEETDALVEAIIPGFVAQVRRAIQLGVLQGYRTEDEALMTVRGRIRFDEQLRRRFGRVPPVEVRYDDFTEDIEENRLIKAALTRLKGLRIRSEWVRRSLGEFDLLLQPVSLVEYHPGALPQIAYTRLNERYRGAIELARLILRATSFEMRQGAVHASSFLVDMNDVFEDFVVTALREALGVSERDFPQGASGKAFSLDKAGMVDLKPDISWWEGGRCVFIGDIKYKRINVTGIKHPDLYQLLAYTVASGLPCGLLIYAAGEGEPRRHEVVRIGKELEVMTLELSGSAEEILRTIGDAASVVRRQRSAALAQTLGAWSATD
jgi:5-methylcytosine-specific restriction enzyme subunit McrC